MDSFARQIKNIAEVIKADKGSNLSLFIRFDDSINRFFITDGAEIYGDAKGSATLDEVKPWKSVHQILKSDLVNVAKNLKEGCKLEIKEGEEVGLHFHVTKKNGSKAITFVVSANKEPFPDFWDSPHCYAQMKIAPEDKATLSNAIKNMNALMVTEYRTYAEYLHIYCDEPKSSLLKQIHGMHCSDFRMRTDCNVGGSLASVHIHKNHLGAVAKVLDVSSKDRHFQLSWNPLPVDENKPWQEKWNVVEATSWYEDNVIILRFKDKTGDSIRVPDTSQIGAGQNCAGRMEIGKNDLMEIIKQGLDGRKDLDLVVRYNSNEFEFVSKNSKCSIFADSVKTDIIRGKSWAAQMNAATLLKLLKVAQGDEIAINFLLATNSDTELMTAQICYGDAGKEANHGYAFFVVHSYKDEDE